MGRNKEKRVLVVEIPEGKVKECDNCLFGPIDKCKYGKVKWDEYCNDFDFAKAKVRIERKSCEE